MVGRKGRSSIVWNGAYLREGGERRRGSGDGGGSARFVHKSSRHAVRSFPPSLSPSLPPSSPRDFFESVNRFCLVKLPTANRPRHTASERGRGRARAGGAEGTGGRRRAGWGTGKRPARAGDEREKGLLSLSLSLTHSLTVHCTNFFRPDRPKTDMDAQIDRGRARAESVSF